MDFQDIIIDETTEDVTVTFEETNLTSQKHKVPTTADVTVTLELDNKVVLYDPEDGSECDFIISGDNPTALKLAKSLTKDGAKVLVIEGSIDPTVPTQEIISELADGCLGSEILAEWYYGKTQQMNKEYVNPIKAKDFDPSLVTVSNNVSESEDGHKYIKIGYNGMPLCFQTPFIKPLQNSQKKVIDASQYYSDDSDNSDNSDNKQHKQPVEGRIKKGGQKFGLMEKYALPKGTRFNDLFIENDSPDNDSPDNDSPTKDSWDEFLDHMEAKSRDSWAGSKIKYYSEKGKRFVFCNEPESEINTDHVMQITGNDKIYARPLKDDNPEEEEEEDSGDDIATYLFRNENKQMTSEEAEKYKIKIKMINDCILNAQKQKKIHDDFKKNVKVTLHQTYNNYPSNNMMPWLISDPSKFQQYTHTIPYHATFIDQGAPPTNSFKNSNFHQVYHGDVMNKLIGEPGKDNKKHIEDVAKAIQFGQFIEDCNINTYNSLMGTPPTNSDMMSSKPAEKGKYSTYTLSDIEKAFLNKQPTSPEKYAESILMLADLYANNTPPQTGLYPCSCNNNGAKMVAPEIFHCYKCGETYKECSRHDTHPCFCIQTGAELTEPGIYYCSECEQTYQHNSETEENYCCCCDYDEQSTMEDVD